ncbi:MAG: hypothetical protein ACPGVG_20190 [Mycobacterium sp.]
MSHPQIVEVCRLKHSQGQNIAPADMPEYAERLVNVMTNWERPGKNRRCHGYELFNWAADKTLSVDATHVAGWVQLFHAIESELDRWKWVGKRPVPIIAARGDITGHPSRVPLDWLHTRPAEEWARMCVERRVSPQVKWHDKPGKIGPQVQPTQKKFERPCEYCMGRWFGVDPEYCFDCNATGIDPDSQRVLIPYAGTRSWRGTDAGGFRVIGATKCILKPHVYIKTMEWQIAMAKQLGVKHVSVNWKHFDIDENGESIVYPDNGSRLLPLPAPVDYPGQEADAFNQSMRMALDAGLTPLVQLQRRDLAAPDVYERLLDMRAMPESEVPER